MEPGENRRGLQRRAHLGGIGDISAHDSGSRIIGEVA